MHSIFIFMILIGKIAEQVAHSKIVCLDFPKSWVPPLNTWQIVPLQPNDPEFILCKKMTEGTIVPHKGMFGELPKRWMK